MRAERVIGSCPAFGHPAGDDRDRADCSRLVGMAEAKSMYCVSSVTFSGRPWSRDERIAILDYCADVAHSLDLLQSLVGVRPIASVRADPIGGSPYGRSKGAFILRCLPSESAVAVRKSTETLDDVPVFDSILRVVSAKGLEQSDATMLVGKRLRMHERHIRGRTSAGPSIACPTRCRARLRPLQSRGGRRQRHRQCRGTNCAKTGRTR